ncbi:MAG: TIGR02646 family protein [Porphyromonadaceae bacterium]|nr:TIGR02646 family protein [Porphyromonadaceae bacterium]
MIQIIKNQCPKALKKYSKKRGASYRDMPEDVKGPLRISLLEEQGFLCAYCMCPIYASECKIEHFLCQDKYPNKALVYGNLLVCCTGGEKKGKEKHCDSAKGNEVIACSPLDPACVESLYYDFDDGTIHSSNGDWENELEYVLKLNTPKLRQKRKEALDGFIYTLADCWERGVDTSPYIDEVNGPDINGKLVPYCGIMRYFLKMSSPGERRQM